MGLLSLGPVLPVCVESSLNTIPRLQNEGASPNRLLREIKLIGRLSRHYVSGRRKEPFHHGRKRPGQPDGEYPRRRGNKTRNFLGLLFFEGRYAFDLIKDVGIRRVHSKHSLETGLDVGGRQRVIPFSVEVNSRSEMEIDLITVPNNPPVCRKHRQELAIRRQRDQTLVGLCNDVFAGEIVSQSGIKALYFHIRRNS